MSAQRAQRPANPWWTSDCDRVIVQATSYRLFLILIADARGVTLPLHYHTSVETAPDLGELSAPSPLCAHVVRLSDRESVPHVDCECQNSLRLKDCDKEKGLFCCFQGNCSASHQQVQCHGIALHCVKARMLTYLKQKRSLNPKQLHVSQAQRWSLKLKVTQFRPALICDRAKTNKSFNAPTCSLWMDNSLRCSRLSSGPKGKEVCQQESDSRERNTIKNIPGNFFGIAT